MLEVSKRNRDPLVGEGVSILQVVPGHTFPSKLPSRLLAQLQTCAGISPGGLELLSMSLTSS